MILVTGGTGFIGGHLLERLSAEKLPVRCLLRRKPRRTPLPSQLDAVYADFTTGAGIPEALAGVDTVIHLAGVTAALRSRDYWTGNVQTTEVLMRALVKSRVRLVHVSSLAAIGPSLDGQPVTEDTEPHPLTNYGKSKLGAERVVRRLAPDAVVVRPPVVYGPRDTAVLAILKPIARGIALEIAGGERWFSAIYVQDLVDGIVRAARAAPSSGGTYFLAHPKPATWADLAATAARIMGRRLRVISIPLPLARLAGTGAGMWSRITGKPGIISREKVREAECRYWTCTTQRAARELGFEATTSLETGLRQTLAWYREAGWLSY